MSIATDGFGTILQSIGGGGGSVVAPGGNISGTYPGSVICEGSVSLTGNVEINGDLFVKGDITNDAGYSVLVHGDMFVTDDIYFDRAITTSPQGNFEVGGNLSFGYMEFRQCAGVAATLLVRGNLIGRSADLLGEGVTPGTPGLTINVGGDFVIDDCDVYGASGGGTAVGGNGGSINVEGSFTLTGVLNAYGGDATDFDAGNGGYVEVHGDLNSGFTEMYLYGGSGTNGNGGNGGGVSCDGNVITNVIEAYGGDCTSDSETHRSGSGGSVDVDADLIVNDYLTVNGGDRNGTLLVGNSLSPPNGGYITVRGDFIVDGDINASGGDLFTTGFAPHDAGNGGNVSCFGVTVCTDDFRAYGGYVATVGNSGNGGSITLHGPVYVDDNLSVEGGYSSGGNAGNGGSIEIFSDAVLGYVEFQGGDTGGGLSNGNGGNGGSFYCYGRLDVDDGLNGNGGVCDSLNETHRSGSGGYLECREGSFTSTTVDLAGGNRNGATTVASTSNPSANGGNFYCYGNLVASSVNLNGGEIFCDFPSARGGNGGTLDVRGTATINGNLTSVGGQGRGNDGGLGGAILISGHLRAYEVIVSGGASVNSNAGVDATTNGSSGNITLQSGVVCYRLIAEDGGGSGAAPTTLTRIGLGGFCTCYGINMTDRAGAWVYAAQSWPAVLRLMSMPYKQTLNNSIGTQTGNISANLPDSIFYSYTGSNWYKVSGATI
jgi:hypothetical protein